jgi:hypothetical protein
VCDNRLCCHLSSRRRGSGILRFHAEYFPEEKEEMLDLRTRIIQTTKKIAEKNELNEKLIKNSLDYINFSVGLITGTGGNPVTYGRYGEANKNEAKKFLDISL